MSEDMTQERNIKMRAFVEAVSRGDVPGFEGQAAEALSMLESCGAVDEYAAAARADSYYMHDANEAALKEMLRRWRLADEGWKTGLAKVFVWACTAEQELPF